MRVTLRQAVEGARDEMMAFARDVAQDRRMTNEEMLRRYIADHRGNVRALIGFARQNAPPDADPILEAVRYEQKMERLMKARGGR